LPVNQRLGREVYRYRYLQVSSTGSTYPASLSDGKSRKDTDFSKEHRTCVMFQVPKDEISAYRFYLASSGRCNNACFMYA
jgi:hypothetical protein